MSEHPSIPTLTPDENAMAVQASTAKHVTPAFVLAYLHWSTARGNMLANLAVQGRLQVLVAGEEGR